MDWRIQEGPEKNTSFVAATFHLEAVLPTPWCKIGDCYINDTCPDTTFLSTFLVIKREHAISGMKQMVHGVPGKMAHACYYTLIQWLKTVLM